MSKKPKTVNQFAAPSDGVQAGAPVETPAPAVRLKKDGTPFKTRGPSGPRTVNLKVKDFTARQATDLALFKANQRTAKRAFMKNLSVEAEASKLQARMEKKALAMTPAELEWLKNQAANLLSANAAKAGAPELEQQP